MKELFRDIKFIIFFLYLIFQDFRIEGADVEQELI